MMHRKQNFRPGSSWRMMGCEWSWGMNASFRPWWNSVNESSSSGSMMRSLALRLLFLLAAFLCSTAMSPSNEAAAGDEVIIVYNARLPESKAVGEYYAQKRHVPTNQMFGIELSTTEEMSRAEFRDALQNPLAREIAAQKLWRVASRLVPGTNGAPGRVEWKPAESRIRYAVLCYGVPLRILPDSNVKEDVNEK